MKKYALISCSKTKKKGVWRAIELYDSALFKKSVKLARHARCEILILSAKYGLIEPNRKICTYNQTLNKMSKQQRLWWATKTNKQLSERIPENSKILLLAGDLYLKNLDFSNYQTVNPLKGLGLGQRLAWLNDVYLFSGL